MTTTTEMQTTVQITKVSDAVGNDNKAQWELVVKWPWAPTNSRFGDTLWLNVEDFPVRPTVAVHNVIAVKGNIKKKQGGQHDGSKDWMWNYRILSFDGTGRPASPTGTMPESNADRKVEELFTGKPEPGQEPRETVDSLDTKILKGQAFNAAYHLIAAKCIDNPLWPVELGIRHLRDILYHEVLEKPVAPPHYCYKHEQARLKDAQDRWWHHVGANYCVEGSNGILDAKGQPVEGDAE